MTPEVTSPRWAIVPVEGGYALYRVINDLGDLENQKLTKATSTIFPTAADARALVAHLDQAPEFIA